MVIIITHVLLVWKVYHTFTIDFSQNHPICRKLFHALSTWGSLEHIWVFIDCFFLNKDLTEFGTRKTYALDFPMLEMRMGFGHRKKPHARDLVRGMCNDGYLVAKERARH